MANTLKHKQSSVAGKAPTTSDLALGELAINTTDGKLYLKKNVSGTETVVDVTAGGAYEPADATILKSADIGSTVQAYDANLPAWPAAISAVEVGYLDGVTSDIQTQLNNKAVTSHAHNYLPLSGGTMTGPITAIKETSVSISTSINLSSGNYFSKTISGSTTLSVSNVPSSGTAASFILDLTNGGSAVISWWSGMRWAGGTAPTLTASGRDVLGFFTHDGGTIWNGFVLGKDVK